MDYTISKDFLRFVLAIKHGSARQLFPDRFYRGDLLDMYYYTPHLIPYICPRNHVALHENGAELQTSTDKITYPNKDGIPNFLAFSAVEDDESIKRLEQLNLLAESMNWKEALESVYRSNSGFVDYVANSERAKFIELLPLTQKSDVLEIGPGLGQFTAMLATRVRSVCALEVVEGQARFAATRCRQEGIKNVQFAVGGDDCRLPYNDGSFDVVVLNLVFEWCGSRSSDEAFDSVQRRFLSEIARVLQPGGVLYIATKNRFALRYLLGKADEHCYGMAFGNALPRALTSLALRWRGRTRIGGMLHSYKALRKMVFNAGFAKIDSYWATPEMRCPEFYVPCNAGAIRRARREPGFLQGDSKVTRFIMPLIPASLVKYLTPGLALLAVKSK